MIGLAGAIAVKISLTRLGRVAQIACQYRWCLPAVDFYLRWAARKELNRWVKARR